MRRERKRARLDCHVGQLEVSVFYIHLHPWTKECRMVMPRKLAQPASEYNNGGTRRHQKCIVRLQIVIHPDLKLIPLSDSNQVHNSAGVQVRRMAMENETFKIGDADHEYLLEEAINRNVLDMEYDDEFESESESLAGEDEPAHPDDIDEDESEQEDEGSEDE